MTVTACLYCPATSDRPFPNSEHVLPQAFGKFTSREGNLTLRSVCPECNAYFGRHLEQHFCRDTGDALHRLQTGLKPIEEAREIGGRRLRGKIDRHGAEDDGAAVSLDYDPAHGVVVNTPPQVALRLLDQEGWTWFREQDITAEVIAAFRTSEYRIYGNADDRVRIVEKLRSVGYEIESMEIDAFEGEADGLVPVSFLYTVDDVAFRTVAKIAFNYLAYSTEGRVPGFVRREEFAAIRAFIRHGTKPAWTPVSISSQKMLAVDTDEYQSTGGHLLGVSWPDAWESPVGEVSLFNEITYVVQFADRAPGIWWKLDSGHHFDIETRQIGRMGFLNPMVLRP
jgi:hypothetical protein